MNHNSYPGREYAEALLKHNIGFDLISIGNLPSISKIEEERCGGLWTPVDFDVITNQVEHRNFLSLSDPQLSSYLDKENYDLGIQGGTGILKPEIFGKFRLGIMNFHPGDLPKYRGCSAPEWQICEGNPVISTAHLIDAGIDTGDIYKKKSLGVDDGDYYHMRASIYPEIAKFMVEVVEEVEKNGGYGNKLQKQNEQNAVYRKYIGDDKINFLIRNYGRSKH